MPQNRTSTGTFRPGTSGNPGGRPRGLARAARELAGDDGRLLVQFWLDVMSNEDARMVDRLEASRLLADRGWGKPSSSGEVERDQAADAPRPEVYRPVSLERALELARITHELQEADKTALAALGRPQN